MSDIPRLRIAQHYVMKNAKEVSAHTTLNNQGKLIGGIFWTSHVGFEKEFKLFKRVVKSAYYTSQLRRCSYCCLELQKNQRTFDLEHIIDKDTHYDYMFETRNLAVSCTLCNGSKTTKNVLSQSGITKIGMGLPWDSDDYLLLHPHLDEWEVHFEFDKFRRIISKPGGKGDDTIQIVGIDILNKMRLNDHFNIHYDDAEKLLRKLYSPKLKPAQRAKYFTLLSGLANKLNSAIALELVDVLKKEIP